MFRIQPRANPHRGAYTINQRETRKYLNKYFLVAFAVGFSVPEKRLKWRRASLALEGSKKMLKSGMTLWKEKNTGWGIYRLLHTSF
jgi:hypothetical protein